MNAYRHNVFTYAQYGIITDTFQKYPTQIQDKHNLNIPNAGATLLTAVPSNVQILNHNVQVFKAAMHTLSAHSQ
jgi:hypothetical protein